MLNTELPGILGVFEHDPALANVCKMLAQLLLRRESTLTVKEREYAAVITSMKNDCSFCFNSHMACYKELEGIVSPCRAQDISNIVSAVADLKQLPTKFRDLTGQEVIEIAEIVAAFCMYNRLVSCLNPQEPGDYEEMGKELAEKGYV